MAISLLELRHIIESGFLPLQYRFTDRTTGANFVVGGIDVATLGTSRAISELIAELRTEFGGLSQGDEQLSAKIA